MFFRKKEKPAEPVATAPPSRPSPLPVDPPVALAAAPMPPATKPVPADNGSPSIPRVVTPAEAANLVEGKDPLRRFAQIVTLLSKTGETRSFTLVDLEWLVVPALRAQQAVVAEARHKDTGQAGPVGLVLWARVSSEVDQRLTRDSSPVPRMSPADWTSGQIPWAVLTIGRSDVVSSMLQSLVTGPLQGKPIKVRARDASGQMITRLIS